MNCLSHSCQEGDGPLGHGDVHLGAQGQARVIYSRNQDANLSLNITFGRNYLWSSKKRGLEFKPSVCKLRISCDKSGDFCTGGCVLLAAIYSGYINFIKLNIYSIVCNFIT